MVLENVASPVAVAEDAWPADVRAILAQLDASFPKMHDRRVLPRWVFHAEGFLTIDHSVRHQLWTRDINAWNVGFVSREPLEVGTHGTLRLEIPGGEVLVVSGQLKRSREFQPGWFEGYLNFMQMITPEVLEKTRP
jgi:hypothetical protein